MRTKRRWLVRVTIYVSGFSAAKCMARVGAEAKWRKKWNKLCMHNMRLKLAVIILMAVNFHRIPNTKVNKTHRTELENYYVFIIADTLHICSFCILNDRIHQSSSSRSELSFGFFVLFVWLFFFFSGVCSVSTVFFLFYSLTSQFSRSCFRVVSHVSDEKRGVRSLRN